eukprot:GFUD01009568.1.p1 GENE.GFUD01009568.1~~GFUD01009568.1.p1  ORF type:complete len:261 (+),score=78.34 GFUD01009568.1:259-1041(+)
MSAGDLVALIQGLLKSRNCQKMEVSPANSCCFCLTLRSGTILIGIGNCLLYLCMFTWYLTSSTIDTGGLRDGLDVTSLDISIFSIFFVKTLVNMLLLVGAVKRIPSLTLPWLCANAVSMMIAMVFIGITILFGTTKLNLNYNEYVTSLTIMGMVTGINLFCWIVVFTFRKNLIMEAQIERVPSEMEFSAVNNQQSSMLIPNAPPPPYNEIEGYKECKPPPEDSPPEYEEAVSISMLSSECSNDSAKGLVLRKKSLTNNAV